MRRAVYAAILTFFVAGPAAAYDQGWYAAEGWSGEYPDGFTMSTDTTVQIRAAHDPAVVADVPCTLRKGSTYHQWNETRARSDHLVFISYNKIFHYEVPKDYTTPVTRVSDNKEMRLRLKRGETWAYLAYLSEGRYLMRYAGVIYAADQDLIERSREIDSDSGAPSDQWIGLTCANATKGWLLFSDVVDRPGFGSPNIVDYGKAEDAQPE